MAIRVEVRLIEKKDSSWNCICRKTNGNTGEKCPRCGKPRNHRQNIKFNRKGNRRNGTK